ncbi:MAG: quinone oxidoreductase family protein, partial [Gammaproteobacteria bacterium]
MTKAIRIHQHGGPEVLLWEDIDLAPPAAGEVRIRHTAVGLNYIDVYHRTGLYPNPLPFTPGLEAVGVVEAVGTGVTQIKFGERVGYATGPLGAYAETRVMPADRLVKVPAGISDEQAAAMLLQGMTVEYLLRRTYPVARGETILIHAAAGGVGLILCQWAKHLGATVIGTVSSDEKAALVSRNGCDHPIVYTREDFPARVLEITRGK